MMAIATIRLKLTMMEARLKCGEADILPQLRDRGVEHDAMRARRELQHLHRQHRHQQHRAEQQRGDRRIAEHRQTRHAAAATPARAPSPSRTRPSCQLLAGHAAHNRRRRPSARAPAAGARRRAPAPRRRCRPPRCCRSRRNASIGKGAACSDAPDGAQLTVAEIGGEKSRRMAAANSTPRPTPDERSDDPERGTFAERARVATRRESRRARAADASDRRLRSTDRDCVENTRKAPVHNATSASMLRLTR